MAFPFTPLAEIEMAMIELLTSSRKAQMVLYPFSHLRHLFRIDPLAKSAPLHTRPSWQISTVRLAIAERYRSPRWTSRTLLLPVEKLLLLRVQRSIPSLQTPTTTLRPNHLSSSASDITPHLKTRKTILEYIVIHYPLMLPSPASEIDALQNSQRQQFVYNASSHLSPRR